MKAAAFEYAEAGSLEEACAHLADAGDEAQIIAGGQSLVPMMAMRLARPGLLVDINKAADLSGIERRGSGLAIKSCTRQRVAELSNEVAEACPLLARALGNIGHLQTRNRGTFGGSLAHADPAAEIPLVAVTLGASLNLHSAGGERDMAAVDFLTGSMTTARADDECLHEVEFPGWQEDRLGTAFAEVSMRQGDFALLAVAAQVALDDAGRCRRAAVGIAGAADRPLALAPVAAALVGGGLSEDEILQAAALSDGLIEPGSDMHADAAYRRRLAPKLVARALREAAAEAMADTGAAA